LDGNSRMLEGVGQRLTKGPCGKCAVVLTRLPRLLLPRSCRGGKVSETMYIMNHINVQVLMCILNR